MAQLTGRGEQHRRPARVAAHHPGVGAGLERDAGRRRGGAVTVVNTPAAAGSPATWCPLPSETDRPVAIETTEIGLLDEKVGSPKSASITTARS